MKFDGDEFRNQDIVIDGNEYARCTFYDCRLIYSGGPLPSLRNCRYQSTGFAFAGAAARTLNVLKTMTEPGNAFRSVIANQLDGLFQIHSEAKAPPPGS